MCATCIEKGKRDQNREAQEYTLNKKINKIKHYMKNSAMSAFIVVVPREQRNKKNKISKWITKSKIQTHLF